LIDRYPLKKADISCRHFIPSPTKEVVLSQIPETGAASDMTDQQPAEREKSGRLRMNLHDRVIFAAPIYEKRVTSHTIVYCTILITPERMIMIPFSSDRVQSGIPDAGHDTPSAKPVRPHGISPADKSSRLESPESCAGEYLDRDADEIIREEKEARVIWFEDVREIVITRVHSDSGLSRRLMILLALYPLKPSGAGYRVDYQLAITTTEGQYTFTTSFSIPLKQVLVDHLGEKVHEIVDEYAPLL